MERLHSTVRLLLIIYVSGVVIASVVAVGLWRWQHVRLYSVQTNSMQPTFQAGDAVLVKQADTSNLHAGEVVSYTSPASPRVIVSHRVISVDKARGLVTTKGDNAKRPDVSFSPNLVRGQVSAVLPWLGHILDNMHKPLGLAVGVYMPAAFVLISEMRRLAKHYGRGDYKVLSYR
ncbi:MAG TPA: signal peptidase I [Candidatus Saccharimonadales bacterium]|nr:signal peptidase I [Candidatus Saccharimonadales bacterium]